MVPFGAARVSRRRHNVIDNCPGVVEAMRQMILQRSKEWFQIGIIVQSVPGVRIIQPVKSDEFNGKGKR
jgi:hypothetical protein